MSNMSYCRFENTLYDLLDCYRSLDDDTKDMSRSEFMARKKLLELCETIAEENQTRQWSKDGENIE